MTLRQRIMLLLSAVVLLLVGLGFGAWVALVERDEAIEQIEQQLEPARAALHDAQAALVDQETAGRGYLLTDDATYLLLYAGAARRLEAAFGELRGLIGLSPRLGGQLSDMIEAAARWQTEVGDRELALAQEGRLNAALEITESGRGRELFAEFRQQALALRTELVAAERDARRRGTTARRWLAGLIVTSGLVAVSLAGATGALLRRWITTPLRRITTAADLVVAGNLHEPIPVSGPPEVAGLAETVERMRARIVGLLTEATAAREALEQEGPAVVMLREELRPEGTPRPGRLAISAAFQPARGFLAGDWYDWVESDDGRVAVVVVDVAGHGEAAGAYALRSKHLLMAALREGYPPNLAMTWLARHLPGDPESFLTAALVLVDAGAGLLHYVNAGHPPPLLAVGEALHSLGPTGPLVGALPGSWPAREVPFPPGSTLVLYTDGVTEARKGHEQFGEARLVEIVRQHAATEPGDLAEACLAEVVDFSGGAPVDDATLLVVHSPHQRSI